MASTNGTLLIPRVNGTIFDSQGGQWTVIEGRIVVNGSVDWSTQRVITLAYVNGLIYQQNADNSWWSRANVNDGWTPTSAPDMTKSMGTLIMSSVDAPIVDASGNSWSIIDSHVAVNGVIDPTTRNVTELAYANGAVWQKNADGLWWSKSSPSDGWNPPYGTPQSPVNGIGHIWFGNNSDPVFSHPGNWGPPPGVPQNGDTATLYYGTVDVDAGYGTGVNFDPEGANARFQFSAPSGYAIGQIEGSGTIAIGGREQSIPTDVYATGLGIAPGRSITIEEFQNNGRLSLEGGSYVGPGATLTVAQLGVNHVPYARLQNDSVLVVDGGTVNVGTLSGGGAVVLANAGQMQIEQTSETIILASGHLTIGTGYSNEFIQNRTVDAPIGYFGSDSTITLPNTQATMEMIKQVTPDVREMFLLNGGTQIADIKFVGGMDRLYASANSRGGIDITAHDNGHSIPIAYS